MGLKRRLEGRKQNLELFQGQAGEIQELHRAEPHVSEPYTTHGPCLRILGPACPPTPNFQTGITSNVPGSRTWRRRYRPRLQGGGGGGPPSRFRGPASPA